MTSYSDLGALIGKQVDEKASAYGPAFKKTAQYLELLYPEGIPVTAYVHVGLLIRMFDKQCRIANGHFDDSYNDIVGYGLLGERMAREATAKVITDPPHIDTDDRFIRIGNLIPEHYNNTSAPLYYTLNDDGSVTAHDGVGE